MTENDFILFDRIEVIKKTIEKYGEENFYISFSGGKDSTVLHHLIDEAIPGNQIPRVFMNTGIEYNDIRRFVEELTENDFRFVIVNSKVNIPQMLKEKGYPFAIHLQDELEVMEKYLPNERKQCELIWKPVYEEYRRIGYRLKRIEEKRLF